MITLTGRFELPDGSPDHGEVWVQAVVTATDVTPRSALVTQAPVVLRLDSAGEVSTELRASDDDGWQTTAPVRYRVSYRLSQRRWWAEYLILAEMGPVVELQRLTPVEEGTEVLPIPVPGLSAYELAVAQGYQGTESEWLASLQGKDAVAPTVQVVETVTGAPGSAASVTDLDSGPDARWRVTIPEGKPSTVPGPPNVLSVGTVTTGAPGSDADLVISGQSPQQVLSLTLPRGDVGPANSLAVGTVTTGAPGSPAAASISGDPPAQVLDLELPRGATGPANSLSIGTVSTGTPGSAAAASITGTPPAQVLSLTLPQGIQGRDGDLTQRMADLRYERRSGLLSEAVWHVDAGAVGTDGKSLIDLSGNDRPAVFGAGAAAPLVLPWDGEDYVYFPDADNNCLLGVGAPAGMATRLVAVFDMDFVPRSIRCFVAQFGQSSLGAKRMRIEQNADGSVAVMKTDGSNAGEIVNLGPWLLGRRLHRFTLDGLTIGYDTSLDGGATWTAPVTKSFTGDRTGIDKTVWSLFAAISDSNVSARGNVYGFTLQHDGETTHALDPRNVNADYTKIKNTGTAGGDWAINRAASGFKTTVVDRPLLLFGGGQTAIATGYRPSSDTPLTVVLAARDFSTGTFTSEYLRTSSGITSPGWDLYRNQFSGAFRVNSDSLVAAVATTPAQSVFVGTMAGKSSPTMLTHYRDGVPGNAVATSGTATPGIDVRIAPGAAIEFLAAAIFDRALTDAEVAQVSAELLGVPHTEQPDPHPQYVLKSQNTRVSRPNGTDRLVEVWDGTAWVVVHYDSGWRNITATHRGPTWTSGEVHIRRIGQRVIIRGGLLSGSPTFTTFWTVPTGWGPDWGYTQSSGVGRENYLTGKPYWFAGPTAGWGGFIDGSAWNSSYQISPEISWITGSALPSSLPGTPYDTAP